MTLPRHRDIVIAAPTAVWTCNCPSTNYDLRPCSHERRETATLVDAQFPGQLELEEGVRTQTR